MTALKDGQWKAPFWGAEKSFITGQDMLGMQNTSIATYGVLLPGLTNLTRRIRYYGFYVWILEQYARRIGAVSVSEFQKFIRRAELLMAYLMTDQFPDTNGVVGSQFTRRTLEDFPIEIDLAKGADREKGQNTYWKYSSGAFGQYYQGALIALKLISPIEANPRVLAATQDLGRELCRSFEQSISENSREVYMSAVEKGMITRVDLEKIAEEFCLINIPENSSEQSFYRQIILGTDFPNEVSVAGYNFFRKDTILLYLSYLNDDYRFSDSDKFWDTFYTPAWKDHALETNTSANGWLYYCINEYTHFCLETLLWHLLFRLEDKSLYLQDALELLAEEIISELFNSASRDKTDVITFREFAQSTYSNGYKPFDEVSKILEVGKNHPEKASAFALKSLGRIHIHIEEKIKDVFDYSRLYRMDREGDCLSFYIWMKKYQNLSIDEFLNKIVLHKIINRHLEVAMRKMRNRNENTLKFTFEDNQLKHVFTFPPVYTTPRIPSLRYFLEDLGFIKQGSHQLTSDGIRIVQDGING